MMADAFDQTSHRHDDPVSLLEAYALHALPEADARAAEAFLATHPERAAEYAQWEETAAMLPYLLEPASPPPQLRTRVLARVYTDAIAASALPDVDATAPVTPVAVPPPIALSMWRERRTRLRVWVQGAVAAVLVFAVIGLGAWALSLQSGVQVRDRLIAEQGRVVAEQGREIAAIGATRTIAGTQSGGAARGQLLRLTDPQAAVLTISGLPPLAQGTVYQVWFVRGMTPVGAGVFAPNPDGTWSGLVRGDVTVAQAVAISVEPAGGSPAPTGDIVATGML